MVTIADLNPHLRTISKRDDDVEQPPKPGKRKRGRPRKTDKK
jgi:hypothetical protein